MPSIDLDETEVRELNRRLHLIDSEPDGESWRVLNPRGRHSIAVGLDATTSILIEGHVGYYCAGMNKRADVTIVGHAGTGLAENIMSGVIRVKGNVSQSAAASGRGGLVVIEGDASARCGISMKGVDIVVGGSIGHGAAFMAQAGNLVVCGDAGAGLGDSIYEATIYVQGDVAGLGADCVEEPMQPEHLAALTELLQRAGMDMGASGFRRFASARNLYNFHVDHAGAY